MANSIYPTGQDRYDAMEHPDYYRDERECTGCWEEMSDCVCDPNE